MHYFCDLGKSVNHQLLVDELLTVFLTRWVSLLPMSRFADHITKLLVNTLRAGAARAHRNTRRGYVLT